jgi:hypothetical protein
MLNTEDCTSKKTMNENSEGRQRMRRRIWLAATLLVAILAVLIVPPLVSIGSYKSRITQLMAKSLGRPVRLSSVELRLLPRPGFLLTDLTVQEDPAFGTEPVLHAASVTASIRLLSLWRGRLEISGISVDDASLNLVRNSNGRWNLDSLFRTAAAQSAGSGERKAARLPYLEATHSRINIKNGAEKLPFSLLDSELSLNQEDPGEWKVRLRGQPARTDVSLDLADTGVVRLEATFRNSAELRQMPVHLDMDWREAQLGQLTRLVIGSDPGWRGDLTGELHLDGTAETAQIKTRLRATGVHRAEFAPAETLDFDARCGFVYHFSARSVEKLTCDSPLGDGHIRLAGDLPGEGGLPHLSVELDKIPVAAGLDALRTVRSGFGPGLEAKGVIGGKISYAEAVPAPPIPEKPSGASKVSAHRSAKMPAARQNAAPAGPLTGSLTVDGLQLSGGGLSAPIVAPRLVLTPVQAQAAIEGQAEAIPAALLATVGIPAGGAGPLTVTTRLALSGYQIAVRGQASLVRARELAHVAGISDSAGLDAVAADPVVVDLRAAGPWMAAEKVPFSEEARTGAPVAADAGADRLDGTVVLHNANWKADYLANHVEISQATLHVDNGQVRWDSVAFSYGPIKGTATLDLQANCATPKPCLPKFQVQFGSLDAGALQAAILGAHEPGTMLSTLIARLRPVAAPAWPQLQGTVKADSLILGSVTLRDVAATLRMVDAGVEITALDAGLLGGRLHGKGTLGAAGPKDTKPAYSLEGQFEKVSPAALGQLLGVRWTGEPLDAQGKIELTGFTGTDLANSAKGTLHFECRHGAVDAQTGASATQALKPKAASSEGTVRFDRWTADAVIANGTISLGQNEIQQGTRRRPMEGAVTIADKPRIKLAVPKEIQAKR